MNPHRTCLLSVAVILTIAATALAYAPNLISYQGRLTNSLGTPVPDSTYHVSFAFYDLPTGGSVQWSEAQDVTTKDGLFTVLLGQVNPIHVGTLEDTALYLSITLNYQELLPRTRLVSTAFAMSAASTAVKSVNNQPRLNLTVTSNLEYAYLCLYNQAGSQKASLSQREGHGASLFLEPEDSQSDGYVQLGTYLGYTAQHHNFLWFNSNDGARKIFLDADSTGDRAAQLPSASVSATEMFDEPGIASNYNTSAVALTATMSDIVTVGITAPAAGYFLVIGKGTAFLSGTLDTNYGYVQVDDVQGGNADNPYRTVFGAGALPNYYTWLFPFTVTRVFPAAAGVYKVFRLEGRHSGTQGSGADIDVRNAQIQVLFFPTAYGSNATLVAAEEAGRFENAVPIEVDGETRYEVDLRELELKAARERAKAEKAEAEAARAEAALERARREEAEKQSQASSAGNH